MYGNGVYFAESITKADEYARPDDKGVCTVLLCRIIGGRVHYNDEVDPDPQALQDSVLFSQYLPSKDQAEIRLNLALKTKLAPQR